jgi:threonine/homoserine/homoserine lactone efflux protein
MGSLFLESLWIGLAIAAPVGPIGLLVIQRTLRHGRVVGLVTGLGAAVADAVYGAVGAFGVSAVIHALTAARVPLALLGGAFLLWLAWRIWHTPPASQLAHVAEGPGLPAAFAGTFVLTLSNPATIFSFLAVFATLGARSAAGADGGALASPWTMIAGVLAGSALWWLLLSGVVGALRQRFDTRAQRLVNRLSALGLALFALWQWWGLVPA